MNHSALKTTIKTATKTTHTQRSEASRLILSGRKLRNDGRTVTPEDAELLKQGWAEHSEGMDLLRSAECGRGDRRYLGLAAALLNGTPYIKCESRLNDNTEPPYPHEISSIISKFLPEDVQSEAKQLVQMWLDGDDIRTLIRPKRAEEAA